MQEKIGNITLDYTFYPGEDFYCDGAIEDRILEIVKEKDKIEYNEVIKAEGSWPILYHLSEERGNIVRWIPMKKDAKVLEVGSGCGAITSTLAKMAGSVSCIDLSKKRSYINAYRNKEQDNVYIHVGNFKDIEPTLDCDYDYVMLIGVFEYGQLYIGGERAYEDFMSILLRHLKPGGHLVIAIENKFGLKYWAGCREDHLGSFFSGLEGYSAEDGVRTFTRNGLEKILKTVGVPEYHFYYPYPDYKFMDTLYSDEHLPTKGELVRNVRNFDRDRLMLFDEEKVFDTILEEELFSLYSNSYVVVTGPKLALPEEISDTSGVSELEAARKKIGNEIVDVKKGEAIENVAEKQKYWVQLYLDYGNGFSEEQSVFIKDCYEKEEKISFSYEIPAGIKQVRIDPASFACILTIDELSVDGKKIKKKKLAVNGKKLDKKLDKKLFVFATEDPGITIKQLENGLLRAEFTCVRMSKEAAEHMSE